MRVLHITRDLPPHTRGGLSIAVDAMLRDLSAHGVQCAVVSFDGYRPRAREQGTTRQDVRHGAEVLRLDGPAALPEARQFAEAGRPDMLHVHDPLLWEFASDVAKALRIPRLLHVHVLHAELDRLRGVAQPTASQRAQARALGEAERVAVPSPSIAAAVATQCASVEVCPSGIDVVQPAQAGEALLLYAGRFADVKGTLEFACSLPRVLPHFPDWKAAFLGGIPDRASAHRRWRDRILRAVGPDLQPRVHVAEAWLGRADLDGWLGRAGVLVVPSWHETFGLTALEGMARGLPIVACKAGGLIDLLEHGRTALLAAPRDREDLAAKLRDMLGAPDLRARLGGAARAEAEARFSRESAARSLLAAYRSTIDQNHP